MKRKSSKKLQSRHLDIVCRDGDVFFSFDRCVTEMAVMRFREQEVRRTVRAQLKRLGPLSRSRSDRQVCIVGMADIDAACKAVRKLDVRLDLIASRPLSPRMVEELLSISKQERLRWTKDGRLPQSGSATFKKGSLITISTHPVDKMLELAANPSVIAKWREADTSTVTG